MHSRDESELIDQKGRGRLAVARAVPEPESPPDADCGEASTVDGESVQAISRTILTGHYASLTAWSAFRAAFQSAGLEAALALVGEVNRVLERGGSQYRINVRYRSVSSPISGNSRKTRLLELIERASGKVTHTLDLDRTML